MDDTPGQVVGARLGRGGRRATLSMHAAEGLAINCGSVAANGPYLTSDDEGRGERMHPGSGIPSRRLSALGFGPAARESALSVDSVRARRVGCGARRRTIRRSA